MSDEVIEEREDAELEDLDAPAPSSEYKCSRCGFKATFYWTGSCPRAMGGCGWPCDVISPRRAQRVRKIRSIGDLARKKTRWISTGHAAIDRVLGGGGLVAGCTVFLGGAPGSGKTTVALMMADGVAQAGGMVYVASSEMDSYAIGDMGKRLGIEHTNIKTEGSISEVEAIVTDARDMGATLLIIDSLQTVSLGGVDGSEGGAAQVNAIANYVTSFAKQQRVEGTRYGRMAVVMISHVGKDGNLAGTMRSAHACDTIAYFEHDPLGDENYEDTLNRKFVSGKNRNGSSGVKEFFLMTERGLVLQRDPRSRVVSIRSDDDDDEPPRSKRGPKKDKPKIYSV